MPQHLTSCIAPTIASLRDWIRRWTRPSTRPILGYVLDRFRSPEDSVRENALLRKQLEVACRQIARPRLTWVDRGMLVLLARLAPTWRSATFLVQPATILRWHRQGLQLFWRRKSRRTEAQPRISGETMTLIEQMAGNNRLWGAERIRGELLKLNIGVAKRTIQRDMRRVRQPRPPGQRWSTFPVGVLVSPASSTRVRGERTGSGQSFSASAVRSSPDGAAGCSGGHWLAGGYCAGSWSVGAMMDVGACACRLRCLPSSPNSMRPVP